MIAEITRQRTVGERLQLDVQHGPGQYTVWIVPAKGMNHEIVGYRVWIGNATLLLGSEEQAVAAALNAIDRIRTAREASDSEPAVDVVTGEPRQATDVLT
jgi:hypothetical protein